MAFLEELKDNKHSMLSGTDRMDISTILRNIKKYESVFLIHLFRTTLSLADQLSRLFQNKRCDTSVVVHLLDALNKGLKEVQNSGLARIKESIQQALIKRTQVCVLFAPCRQRNGQGSSLESGRLAKKRFEIEAFNHLMDTIGSQTQHS